jgi:hypothetical protein
MALFITLGLISRPSAKMLSLAQHLSVYAVSCTVGINFDTLFRLRKSVLHNKKWAYLDFSDFDV